MAKMTAAAAAVRVLRKEGVVPDTPHVEDALFGDGGVAEGCSLFPLAIPCNLEVGIIYCSQY